MLGWRKKELYKWQQQGWKHRLKQERKYSRKKKNQRKMETEDSLAQLPKKMVRCWQVLLSVLTTIMCNIHTERDKNMKSVKRFFVLFFRWLLCFGVHSVFSERVGPTVRAGLHLMADAPEEMRGGRDNQRWRGDSCTWERGEWKSGWRGGGETRRGTQGGYKNLLMEGEEHTGCLAPAQTCEMQGWKQVFGVWD